MNLRWIGSLAVALAGCLMACYSSAQGIATDQLIDAITVTAQRDRGRTDVPNPTDSITAIELREQNLVNPEDALRYAPNLTVRKRYIGDRNALIGGRSFSPLQAPRALVLMDGYLLSNFLGRFDAPRWNMIAPEEIERVDVLYGPYSALYPGNSIGTTIALRTHRPSSLQSSARVTLFSEQFSQYGIDETFSGRQISMYVGDTIGADGWVALSANRQEATSHPMQYYSVSANASGDFPATQGVPVPVTGVRFDTDPQGRRRAVFGANAGAIDRSRQEQVKLRAGHLLTDTFELEGFVALWRNAASHRNRTFMRDAANQPVWSGLVSAEGIAFEVPPFTFAPSERRERHRHWGATLRTTRPTGWNGSLVYSQYRIVEDSSRQALVADPFAGTHTPGTDTRRDGTGWRTFEAQAVYAPAPHDSTGGEHALAAGVHQNEYELHNPVLTATRWRQHGELREQQVEGRTRLTAVYAQDRWLFAEAWSITAGARYERWRAFDGSQLASGTLIYYPERRINAWSPKLSIAFSPSQEWTWRLSAGRGVRFPTVAELFQGTTTATSIIVNDPQLRAERSDSLDFTVEHVARWGRLRASFFEDDVRDSIFAQTNITVTPNITNVQNIERVRTRGIESAFELADVVVPGVSLQGNIAYARSRIERNHNFPVSVGNEWPRVPRWRANLQASWRPNHAWLATLGLRHSGRMYNRLQNDDVNPDTYGGVSRFTCLDARLAYSSRQGIELALGVDNLTNEQAYQAHPLPMRTGYLEVRWSFEEIP